jgi:hypothetical protein
VKFAAFSAYRSAEEGRNERSTRERGGVIYEENGSRPFVSAGIDFGCDNSDDYSAECVWWILLDHQGPDRV